MTRKPERVLQAVFALIQATLPNAKSRRGGDFPERVEAGGNVIMRDGDPGEPETDMSPLAYNFQHEIGLEIAAPDDAMIDALFGALADAADADRTLGGLCEWLELRVPVNDDLADTGTAAYRAAQGSIVAHYRTDETYN